MYQRNPDFLWYIFLCARRVYAGILHLCGWGRTGRSGWYRMENIVMKG